MGKKVLLMINKAYGYENRIKEELKKQGYEVEFFDISSSKYSKARKIKNPFLRIYNDKYLKKFKGVNLKDIREGKVIIDDLKKSEIKYDIFLKIGCVYLAENVLIYLKKISKNLISYHWDSSKKIDKCNFLLEKKYFDKICSFDKEDVEEFKLKYFSNFYCENADSIMKIQYDIYTMISKTEEKRESILKEIAKICLLKNITYDITLYDSKIHETKKELIKITNKTISLNEMLEKEKKAKVLLEILHTLNKGCTFRTFDCIGMRKKLITNNKDIVNEDFYNPNNILIIDEKNINVPREFIDSPYEDLPEEIYEKYSLENWIKQLLDVK